MCWFGHACIQFQIWQYLPARLQPAATAPRALLLVRQHGGLLQSAAVSGAPLSERFDAVASYELHDLPERRLRRWPRGARRDARPPLHMWNMLEPYRWPWDD